MDQEQLNAFVQLLRAQRNHFLSEFRRAERDLDVIAEERESELEEHAQEEQTARFLTRLDDQALQAVKEIDAALQRILDGKYGQCQGCHKSIAKIRLRSLPATRFCKRCSARQESRAIGGGGETETPAGAPIPADLLLLDDNELTEEIREHLKEDGRVDTHELHVVCRKGVVYLSGRVPSEAERQILHHTLTDVLGLLEVVDHLDIEPLLWQTERRAKEIPPEITQRWEEPPGTEDVVENTEEGKEFVAPVKPPPDES